MTYSRLAVDLEWCEWPEWMAATLYRFGPLATLDAITDGARRPHSWRIIYRAALDHSGLPIVDRSVLRVLTDRATGDAPISVPEIANADVAERTPCALKEVSRAYGRLEAAGWLGRTRRHRRPPVLVLLVPAELGCATRTQQSARGAPMGARGALTECAWRTPLESLESLETSGDARVASRDVTRDGRRSLAEWNERVRIHSEHSA